MIEKDNIKFVIKYLKYSLKHRTPNTLNELMKEQGFLPRSELEKYIKEIGELKEKLNNLSQVADIRLANWQKYSQKCKEYEEIIENSSNKDIKS